MNFDLVLAERRLDFGFYLRELRESRRFSLREAAGRIGMSSAKLARIETGGPGRVTSGALLRAFAELYGVPAAEVFDRAGFHVDSAALAAAREDQPPRQRAVVVELPDEDPAAPVSALIAAGWRVLALVPLAAPAGTGVGGARILVLVEK